MFKLLKILLGMCCLAGFVWFGANIPLGSRTLFQHLQAIGKTRETQDLLDGTKESAKPLVEGVKRRLGGSNAENVADVSPGQKATAVPDGGVAPDDRISESDRESLRKVLGAKTATRQDRDPAGKLADKTAGKRAKTN
jgi:hypothetical protein